MIVSWALGMSACGSVPRANDTSGPRRVADEPLLLLYPEGASTLVELRPRELERSPAMKLVGEALLSEEEAREVRERLGFDLRALESLTLATYGNRPVVLLRGSAVRASNEGVASPAVGRRMERLDDDLVLLADPGPSAEDVAFRVRNSEFRDGQRPALHTAEHRALFERHADAPLLFLLPVPLAPDPSTSAGLLLARERALAVAFRPVGKETVEVTVDLRGEFPPGAEANFQRLVASLAEDELGRIFGISNALPGLRVVAGEERVVLRLPISAPDLARGIELFLRAEIAEIVSFAPTSGGQNFAKLPGILGCSR